MNKHVLTGYTVSFNALSAAAWLVVALRSIEYYTTTGVHSDFYSAVQCSVQIAQTLAVLEIVHAATGLVRSSPITGAMQVLSRVHMVWIVWNQIPLLAARNAAVASTVIAWTLGELIRYPFYICSSVMDSVPMPLKYLRYSAFIVLYPIGITSEACCVLAALPVMKSEYRLRHWPVAMPNVLNFELSLFHMYVLVLVLYVPGTVILFTHMLRQRKKALGSLKVDKTA
eukprot:Lankesteria_metandrocarpae@DN9383_c0_g1_i1.p1